MKLVDYLAHVARVYLAHPHEPDNLTVRRAYDALKRELDVQYTMVARGLQLEHTDTDPYLTSSAMFTDIADNRRLRVYTGATLPDNHPLKAPYTPILTYNDAFRAVHDALAHYPGRHGFGPKGEYRAYRAHCTFLSFYARWAIATETLAQFACYFYGPDKGTFAPQKATLLPLDLLNITPEDI